MPKKNKIVNNNSGIYFRSNGNNWGLSNEFLDLGNGSYVARNVNISKGLNEFKIADSNWSTNCNFGYSSEKPVMLYHNYILSKNCNDNIKMIAHNDYCVDVFIHFTNRRVVMRIHSAK